MPRLVNAAPDLDTLPAEDKVHAVGKAVEEDASQVPVDDRKGSWRAGEEVLCLRKRRPELHAKPWALRLIPVKRGEGVGDRLGAIADRVGHGRLRSRSVS